MERGWSQEKFADICGVHRTYMGHIERGEKNVSFNTLARLAEALRITLPELLTEGHGVKRVPPKSTRRPRVVDATDLGGLVRELNARREILEQTADALKGVANVLRAHQRKTGKIRKH